MRSIHPKISLDEDFVALTPNARAFIIALGTFSDYADRFPWDLPALEEFCGKAFPDIPTLLDELLESGLIRREGDVGEILFAFGFSRKRISKWENLRSLVFIRDGHICQYCGSTEKPLHCDHVVPVSRGGTSDLSNLATACKRCNLAKGNKLLEEWGGSL